MKIKTSKGLEDISTAVFYRRHPFIPTDISKMDTSQKYKLLEDSISTQVYHLGSLSSSDLLDFAEYDFSYEPNKGRFRNILQLNFLDTYSKNILGYNTKDNTLLDQIIFPQISSNPTSSRSNAAAGSGDDSYDYLPILPDKDIIDENFFGAIEVSHQTIALLKVLGENNEGAYDGIYKIEIYNDHITGNCQRNYRVGTSDNYTNATIEGFVEWDALCQEEEMGKIGITPLLSKGPVITICLGPQPENKNIENDKRCNWFYGEGFDYGVESTELSAREYESLVRELSDQKIIWFLISSDGTASEINLAYKAWTDCRTKHRNMDQFFLRNDKFFSSKDSMEMFNSLLIDSTRGDEILYDEVSKTILGTRKTPITSLPIYNQRKLKGNKLGWSPHVIYNKGDLVTLNVVDYRGKQQEYSTFRSLVDNNKGKDPRYSIEWIKNTLDLSSGYYRYFVGSNITGAGSIEPSGTMIVKSIAGVKQPFKIKLNVGYILHNNIMVDGDDVVNEDSEKSPATDEGIQEIVFGLNSLQKGANHDYQVFIQFKRVGCNLIIVAKCPERQEFEYLTSDLWGKLNSGAPDDCLELLTNIRYGINSYFPTTNLKDLLGDDEANKVNSIPTEIGDKVLVQLPKELPSLGIKRVSYVNTRRDLLNFDDGENISNILSDYTGDEVSIDENNQILLNPDNTYNYLLIDLEEKRFTVRITGYTGVEVNEIRADVIHGQSHDILMKGEGIKKLNRIVVKDRSNSKEITISGNSIGTPIELDGGTKLSFLSYGVMPNKILTMTISNIASNLDFEIFYA